MTSLPRQFESLTQIGVNNYNIFLLRLRVRYVLGASEPCANEVTAIYMAPFIGTSNTDERWVLMDRPSNEETKTGIESRYALVIAVAKRAKQLREGISPLVQSKSKNPITIALEEIQAGKLKVLIPSAAELEAAEQKQRGRRETPAELLGIPEEKHVVTDVLPVIQPDMEEDSEAEELADEKDGAEVDEREQLHDLTDTIGEETLQGEFYAEQEEEQSDEVE